MCEIEATGEIIEGNDKCVTNKIKIIREINKEEMYELGNEGKNNTGLDNTGNRNTGDWNTGDWNTGNRNTGYCNTGYWNTGNRNTGYWNTGYWNTGYCNTGYWNTGNRNTGYWNTGDWNTGDWNTGDWNKTNRSAGIFCNEEPKLIMFNKETDMTFEEWENTRAYEVLEIIDKSVWVNYEEMTEYEKKQYESAKTCGGYLKEIPRKNAVAKWWRELDIEDKQEIFNLPNFDLDIFNDIMESDISEEEYKRVMQYDKD